MFQKLTYHLIDTKIDIEWRGATKNVMLLTQKNFCVHFFCNFIWF